VDGQRHPGRRLELATLVQARREELGQDAAQLEFHLGRGSKDLRLLRLVASGLDRPHRGRHAVDVDGHPILMDLLGE